MDVRDNREKEKVYIREDVKQGEVFEFDGVPYIRGPKEGSIVYATSLLDGHSTEFIENKHVTPVDSKLILE